MRDRTGASWGHKWALRTLHEHVEHKAEAERISVNCAPHVEHKAEAEGIPVNCESEANAEYNAALTSSSA